jgi:hypothetical protein
MRLRTLYKFCGEINLNKELTIVIQVESEEGLDTIKKDIAGKDPDVTPEMFHLVIKKYLVPDPETIKLFDTKKSGYRHSFGFPNENPNILRVYVKNNSDYDAVNRAFHRYRE